MNHRQKVMDNIIRQKQGFTLVEVMIVVAILAILGAIAIPLYTQYSDHTKKSAAVAVIESFPILLETYRAENGTLSPAPNVNGVYTYSYTENNSGGIFIDQITPIYPDFRPKSVTQKAASLYHYQIVITVAGCPACTQTAVFRALPQTNRGAPADNIDSSNFN